MDTPAPPHSEHGPIGPGTPHARMMAMWRALGERSAILEEWSDYNPWLSNSQGMIEVQALIALDRLSGATTSQLLERQKLIKETIYLGADGKAVVLGYGSVEDWLLDMNVASVEIAVVPKTGE